MAQNCTLIINFLDEPIELEKVEIKPHLRVLELSDDQRSALLDELFRRADKGLIGKFHTSRKMKRHPQAPWFFWDTYGSHCAAETIRPCCTMGHVNQLIGVDVWRISGRWRGPIEEANDKYGPRVAIEVLAAQMHLNNGVVLYQTLYTET